MIYFFVINKIVGFNIKLEWIWWNMENDLIEIMVNVIFDLRNF